MINKENTPCVLIILDGWGIAATSRANAISQAKKPFFDGLVSHYATFSLQASGEVVGLNWGEMGNSEVGHLTLGSGKTIYQSEARINKSIIDKTFFSNPVLLQMQNHIMEKKSSLHCIGLVSDGGVHSHIDHLYAILDFCKMNKIKSVYIHAILDGRDTMKDSAITYIKALQKKIQEVKVGEIATLSGRFYAMDRDSHWDRTELAFNAMADGISSQYFEDPASAIQSSYDNNIFDETLKPVVLTKFGKPITHVHDNDTIIFFNFRADRARQLTSSFILPGFEKFYRKRYLKNLQCITFTQYDKDFPSEVLFLPTRVNDSISKIISQNGLKQLHAAETEKYAHVTFFFNGGVEEPQANEDRLLIPSPLVQSYDQKPEMSAYELTNKILKEISRNYYDFMVINFANADMVGHTGNIEATTKAVQIIDECLKKIVNAVMVKNGTVLITADHGNAEEMIEMSSGKILKVHSKNPVPCIFVGKRWLEQNPIDKNIDDYLYQLTPSGMLSDVAPTILKILGLPKSPEMTGSPLL